MCVCGQNISDIVQVMTCISFVEAILIKTILASQQNIDSKYNYYLTNLNVV